MWYRHQMGIFAVLNPLQKDGLVALAILAAAAFVATLVKRITFLILERIGKRHENGVIEDVLRRASAPCAFAFPLVGVELTLIAVRLPDWIKIPFEQALGLCIIAAAAWTVVSLIELATDLSKRRYQIDAEDNLRARQAETRLDILNRTATTLVLLVATSIGLMTFPAIRAIGATLLASAGLIGLAAAVAARPFFENLVAGIQIALTQPIRIDDVVIVEKEYGHIEKITATYVVVRLWDQRRMVLPLSYFINTPFQNWTYSTANLTGSVELQFDYSVPIQAIRDEALRLVRETQLWDHQTVNVSMTDATKDFAQIRVLVSARNSSQLFELRCFLRERLIGFISEHYPSALPGVHTGVTQAEPVHAGSG